MSTTLGVDIHTPYVVMDDLICWWYGRMQMVHDYPIGYVFHSVCYVGARSCHWYDVCKWYMVNVHSLYIDIQHSMVS